MASPKCPKCEKAVGSLSVKGTKGHAPGTTWACVTLSCPSCGAVLGAQIDPVALKTDTVRELFQALRKQRL